MKKDRLKNSWGEKAQMSLMQQCRVKKEATSVSTKMERAPQWRQAVKQAAPLFGWESAIAGRSGSFLFFSCCASIFSSHRRTCTGEVSLSIQSHVAGSMT